MNTSTAYEKYFDTDDANLVALKELAVNYYISVNRLKTVASWLVPPLCGLLLLTIVGNLILVIATVRYVPRHTATPNLRFCISLATADIWTAYIFTTGLLINSYFPLVHNYEVPGNACLSFALEIFRIAAMLTSDLHLLVIAVNHLFGISRPIKHKVLFTTSRVRVMIALVWLVPCLLIVLVFAIMPYLDGDGLFGGPNCIRNFYFEFPMRAIVFSFFCFPIIVTVIIYAYIIKHLLKNGLRSAQSRSNSVAIEQLSTEVASVLRRNSGPHTNRYRMVLTTSVITATFVAGWLPCVTYFALVCLRGCPIIYGQSLTMTNGLIVSCVVNALVCVKLGCNPFIYAFRLREVRCALRRLFCGKCRSTTQDAADGCLLGRQYSTQRISGCHLK